MKKKITTAMLIAAMSMSIMACSGGKTTETQAPTTEAPAVTETVTTTEAPITTETPDTESVDNGIIDFEASDCTIKYLKHEFATDWDGDPCLLYYFTFTNTSDTNESADSTVILQCFQNGIECNMTQLEEDNTEISRFYKDIQPGTSVDVCAVFKLEDNSEITMEASDFITFGTPKGNIQKITVE